MQKLFLAIIAVVTFSACSVTSNTVIGPKKEFELGDGKHGSFTAAIKNVSNATVEIYKQPLGGEQEKVVSLSPGQKATVTIAADTKAIFKNLSNGQASLNLKLTGDTGLSMGGPNY
jgi:ABC-type Fe3+-hydroxamate transport system substrate-binding protein